ncbi:hypothetical protein O3P69_018600 [Scylla paramamosain]|uniref:Uncharacterized protein n=1 Tax=Scylla paramamosain TaxID=85552 RepID=A0AAW0T2Q6_SCYPA
MVRWFVRPVPRFMDNCWCNASLPDSPHSAVTRPFISVGCVGLDRAPIVWREWEEVWEERGGEANVVGRGGGSVKWTPAECRAARRAELLRDSGFAGSVRPRRGAAA